MLEQAFDQLCAAGFRMVGSCASGTSAPASSQDLKPGQVICAWIFLLHLFLPIVTDALEALVDLSYDLLAQLLISLNTTEQAEMLHATLLQHWPFNHSSTLSPKIE